jgi:proline iminopeptidase
LTGYKNQFQTEKIPRSGFDLYYRSLGTGEPILILSGGPGDACDYMLPVASEVAKHAHAILLEQRGTGRSLTPRIDKSTINLALSLEGFEVLRSHLKVERWTIIGHSAVAFWRLITRLHIRNTSTSSFSWTRLPWRSNI